MTTIVVGFAVSLAIVLIVPIYVERDHEESNNKWYRSTVQPNVRLAPPTWVFPVVWTILYLAMAAAIALWTRIQPSTEWNSDIFIATWVLIACNLLFNRLWTLVFFSFRDAPWSLTAALVDAFLIFGTAVAVVVLFHLSPETNGWVFGLWYPYVAWTGFAFLLTLSIWAVAREGHLTSKWVDPSNMQF